MTYSNSLDISLSSTGTIFWQCIQQQSLLSPLSYKNMQTQLPIAPEPTIIIDLGCFFKSHSLSVPNNLFYRLEELKVNNSRPSASGNYNMISFSNFQSFLHFQHDTTFPGLEESYHNH